MRWSETMTERKKETGRTGLLLDLTGSEDSIL